jgi:hypothetical protein
MQEHFTAEQRLEILRASDGERKWYSLEDQRACVVCDRVFTGWQVEICRDQRGRYLLKCPTQGCPSYFAHWFYVFNGSPAAANALHVVNGHDHIAEQASSDDIAA